MARWQSKAQIEEQANEAAKRQVVAAVKEQVAQLVAGWNESGYPGFSECEKAISVVIRTSGIVDTLSENVKYNARTLAIQHFMDAGIGKVLRDRQRQQEKEKREAFKLASATRKVVEEGTFNSSMAPGEVGIITSKNGPDRVLTCLTCEFVRAPRDMGQDDDGYVIELAEPTDEEKATEAYQRATKKVADDLAYKQRQTRLFEDRRQAELDAIRATGEEPDFFDEIFAGTSDN